MKTTLSRSLALVLTLFASLVFAETLLAPATPPLVLPSDLTDLGAVGQLVFHAFSERNWGLLASGLVILLVGAARKFLPENDKTSALGKIGDWVRSKRGGIITNLVLAYCGALATAFLAHAPVTPGLFFSALQVSLAASGGWTMWKNWREAQSTDVAKKVGAEAAANPEKTLNS